jgi:hypothetical protein
MMLPEIYGSTMALFGTTWAESKVIKDLQEPQAHQVYRDLQAHQELQAQLD